MSKSKIGPIHKAVMAGSLSDLRAAIANGSDVNAIDREGRSALFYAVQDGNVSVVDELLKNGANVNIKDSALETPLHFAARSYQFDAAKLLLDNGAIVDAQDANGNTPLSRAVYDSKGRGSVIQLLLSFGSDKFLKNSYGMSPLDLANSIGNYDVKSFLA